MPGNTKKHRRGNGEGSVYQRKDGTWAAVLTVGVKPDGKPDRKFLYGKTRKEVADKLREAQNKLDAGVIPGGDNVLFSTWVMNWLEVVIKPGIKERTYINYKASIEKHIIPGIRRYKLKDITDVPWTGSSVFSYPTATTYYSCFRIRCRQGTYK